LEQLRPAEPLARSLGGQGRKDFFNILYWLEEKETTLRTTVGGNDQ